MRLVTYVASHSKLKRTLVIAGIGLTTCLLLLLLLTLPAVCVGVCASTGHTFVSACFTSGHTRTVALDALLFDRGVCLYLCGQTVRHIGACGCPNECSASLGRGACTEGRCVCTEGWGGADCSSVTCPHNRCSGHGRCISDDRDTDRCECNIGWTAHDCSAPVVHWNATPAGELCEHRYYAADDHGDAHPLWNMSEIATVRITLKSKHFDRLIDANTLWTADYEKADFEFYNSRIHELVKHVGVKVRGANTRKMAQKSWSVSFTKYDKQKRWLGLRKINLRAHADDPSMLRHTVGITMYRSMCIPTYRSSFAMVWINGISYGLHNMVEDLDRDFLKSRYGESEGNLYKPSQPCSSLSYISEDPKFYERYQCKYTKGGKAIAGTCTYEQAEGSGDWSDFAKLIRTMYHATGPDRLAQIGSKMSLASWTRAAAVDVAMARYDGYAAYGNNWYLYRRQSDGLFYAFSTDYSSDMRPETVTYPLLPFNTSWPRYWSRCGPWNRILYMQHDSADMQRSLIGLVRNFSRAIYSNPAITKQLQILREQLSPLVATDPFTSAIGGAKAWSAACDELLTVLRDRSAWLQDETIPLSEVTFSGAVFVGACFRAAAAAIVIALLALCCVERADCIPEGGILSAPPPRSVVCDESEDLDQLL